MIEIEPRARASACLLVLALGACAPAAGKQQAGQTPVSIDSLVLERTACFGVCPVYRLRINSAEEIRFESRNRTDSGRVAVDTASAGTYASIISRARAAGFYELPSQIEGDPVLCPRSATDLPTVITSIFSGSTTKQVVDDHGCFENIEHKVPGPLRQLRALENGIDSTLHSSRWVRPNRPAK